MVESLQHPPTTPSLQYSHPHVIPSLRVWTGLRDSLLTNRIQWVMECHLQDWLAQRPWLPSTVSCLLSLALLLAVSEGSQPLCHELFYRKDRMASNWERKGLQRTTSKELSYEGACEWVQKWIFPQLSLEMTAAQANPCQLVTGLEPEDPAKSYLDSWETVR